MAATPTGLGIHYSSHGDAYRQQDADVWIPELQSMGIHWLAISGKRTRAIPVSFLERLLGEGIEPILFLDQEEISPLEETAISILRSYQRAGVKLIAPFPSPNLRSSWPSQLWPSSSPVDAFLDIFLPAADILLTEGLIPVFPSLKPGGDYWDLSFLEGFLRGVVQKREDTLASNLVLATDLSAGNRPLDWGSGCSARWPQARPYITPPGSQDSLGFQGYMWRDEIVRRTLGESLPMIGVRAGATLADTADPAYPAVDASRHADINLQVAQMASGGSFKAPMLCILFWLLQSGEKPAVDPQAWYRPDGTVLPIVDILKRKFSASAAGKTSVRAKAIRHYVLLPQTPVSLSSSIWNQVRAYLQAFQASCGFSMDEALQSEKVTVVGESVPSALVLRLRDSGCFVDFLSTENSV
jgi:hypothetical protein